MCASIRLTSLIEALTMQGGKSSNAMTIGYAALMQYIPLVFNAASLSIPTWLFLSQIHIAERGKVKEKHAYVDSSYIIDRNANLLLSSSLFLTFFSYFFPGG